MNPIQKIEALVRNEFPNASLCVDRPKNTCTGYWFLDIKNGTKKVVVEWQPDQGFGVSELGEAGTELEVGFGEGPQQFHKDQDAAVGAIRTILNT